MEVRQPELRRRAPHRHRLQHRAHLHHHRLDARDGHDRVGDRHAHRRRGRSGLGRGERHAQGGPARQAHHLLGDGRRRQPRGELGCGRQCRRLQGAVEVRQPELQHRQPPSRRPHRPQLHHCAHAPARRGHDLHGARHRHARPRGRRHGLGRGDRRAQGRGPGPAHQRHGDARRRQPRGDVDRGDRQPHRLHGAVEDQRRGVGRRPPDPRHHRHQRHHCRPDRRDRLHRPRHRHAHLRGRRPGVHHGQRAAEAGAAGFGRDRHGDAPSRPARGVVDGRGQRGRLQSAVEGDRRAIRRRHPPALHYRPQLHHHQPDPRHGLHGAGDRHAHQRRGRRAVVRGERRAQGPAAARAGEHPGGTGDRRGGGGLGRGGRRDRLHGAVEDRRAELRHHAPSQRRCADGQGCHVGFVHHHRPDRGRRLHRAGDRHAGARGRRPGVAGGHVQGGQREPGPGHQHPDRHTGHHHPGALVAGREGRHGLPGAVEIRRRELQSQHAPDARHADAGRRRNVHDHGPDPRHRLHGAPDAPHQRHRSDGVRTHRHDARRDPRAIDRDPHAGRRLAGRVLDRGDRQSHRLPGAVEVRQRELQHRRPPALHHRPQHHHPRLAAGYPGHGARHRHAHPRRRGRPGLRGADRHAETRAARPSGNRDGHAGRRLAGRVLDRGVRRRRLPRAVEVRQPELQHRRPPSRRHLRHQHHHCTLSPARGGDDLHGARDRHAHERGRRHGLGRGDRHSPGRDPGPAHRRHGDGRRRQPCGAVDRGDRQSHRLHRAVEERRRGVEQRDRRHRHQPHHHRPGRRHGLHGARDRHAHLWGRRPRVRPGDRHAHGHGFDRAGKRHRGRGRGAAHGDVERGGRRQRLQGAVEGPQSELRHR